MRTPLALLAVLALATLPVAAATAGLQIEAAGVGASIEPQPEPSGGADPLAAPTLEAPELSPQVASDPQRLLESSGVRTSAGGAGFTARAEANPGAAVGGAPFDNVVDALVPTMQDAAPAAVATVGIAALLQAIGAWRFLGLGAVGLYSRLTKSDLLDNVHRDGVFKLIQETPGLGVSEIAAHTGLGWGTTVYHLDRLERAGFVANERGGLHKCYYPVGTLAREVRKGMGALKADTTRNIAEFLVAKPGATQSELCSALGLSPSAASKQVTKLEEAGLVRRERDWKTVHLFPQEQLTSLMGGTTVSMPSPVSSPLPA